MNPSTVSCSNCQHVYPDSALFCPNCGTAKVRTDGDSLLGKILGERFLVQERLGQGTSGTIYRAEHITLRRKVAIKVLHAELARDDLAVERFRREATMVAEVDNEHIVEIHDFGRAPDGRLYLAMEMLEGETLDAVLHREGRLSVERTADILIQLGEALMEAHAVGYVHRDLRPRNIYLAVRRGKANFVKLLDFGLSKLVESDAHAASTSLGMTFGDPRYMSPEQARGDRIDRRADIYQLGCITYEMLTGAPPFTGTRVFDVLTRHVTESPAPLPGHRPDAPLWMESAVARMLAKNPDDRFATTSRLVEALRCGLERGEVMQDKVARQRETIPPPSVSRAIEKLGVGDEPAGHDAVSATRMPPLSSAAISTSSAPPPTAAMPATLPVPPGATASRTTMVGTSAAVVAAAAAAVPTTSPELIRRRTGTPRVGVPVAPHVPPRTTAPATAPPAGTVAASPAAVTGSEVAGPVAHVSAPVADIPTSTATSMSIARAKAAIDPGVSQVWFEDEESAGSRATYSRRTISASNTDVFFDSGRRRRRLGLIVGGVATLVLGGVVLAWVSGADTPAVTPVPQLPAPSQVVAAPQEPPLPVISTPIAPEARIKPEPPVAARSEADRRSFAPTPRVDRPRPAIERPRDTSTGDDPLLRRPGNGSGAAGSPTSAPPVVESGAKTVPSPAPGVSGGDGTLDPYGSDGAGVEPEAIPAPIKKAEELATVGQQNMQRGDLAGAAASFKKAVELDGKNLIAVAGLGEIALQQGLFGDAIAHLTKASKLAPRSARIQTLLGEALLNSGNREGAALAFKRALQIDPDNSRARDGYNDASSGSTAGTESP
jgi:eukaryotic-like serine/threonine-protein kinase